MNNKSRYIEIPVKQKAVEKLCYALIQSADEEFDLTDYITKPAMKMKS